jgi:Plavaka transposase
MTSQDQIAEKPETHGSMFVPIILGSDKTTVSVAMGQNEYYPLYMSIGNVHNSVRRAHRNALMLVAFLAIPKSASSSVYYHLHKLISDASANKKHSNTTEFRNFKRQLFHTSITQIFHNLGPYMNSPEVTRCPDGHYRRIIYGLGPYIADYPEQVLLTCIVQGWCAR